MVKIEQKEINMKNLVLCFIFMFLIYFNIYTTSNAQILDNHNERNNDFIVDVFMKSNGWHMPGVNKRITIKHASDSTNVFITIIDNLTNSNKNKKININK